ncbi:C-C chemokine receptor-like 2 [Artibeus jamaicensis]|uniref:C-C chemokine receptor-like 2 n=1 Tax=Artibeus jamaicensis TaxID=9417 RepID=UPI00235A5AC8|nr:C-C chemokine receptor-like 2 [Artibeus jamaicensis]XP_036985904.2 C-C chemokine receptor-like 2 [Artibeus jamaicensis]XP_036985905.2 C-C chemokine receptor-like 2 [Artibeus jamaicensis]XP_053525512.1 C-C chemokine receptor-like 2 [Artibeus jamaicensis]
MANYTLAPDDDYDVLIENDLNNSDTEQCHPYDATGLLTHVVPQLYTAVFLVGLLDNFLAVLALVKYKGLGHVENIYFLNLVISNCCFLSTLPFWAHAASHGGRLGHPTCMALVTLCSVGLHGEVLFSALLSLQSCLGLFQSGFSSVARTVPCGIVASVLAWGVAVLVTLPELLFHISRVGTQQYQCLLRRAHLLPDKDSSWERSLTLKSNVVVLVVPLLVFTVCFVLFMRRRKRLRSGDRNKDLVKLVFAIMAVFLLMWGPYNVALFLSTFKKSFSLHDCRALYSLDKSVQVTRVVASTHCCVNPLLCVLLDKAFRKPLSCCCRLGGDTPLPPAAEPAHDRPWEGLEQSTDM